MARSDRLSADALSARLNRLSTDFTLNVENEARASRGGAVRERAASSNSLSATGFQAGRRHAIMQGES